MENSQAQTKSEIQPEKAKAAPVKQSAQAAKKALRTHPTLEVNAAPAEEPPEVGRSAEVPADSDEPGAMVPSSKAKRKTKSSSQRSSQQSAAKRRAPASLKRLWEVSQESDELQPHRVQVDFINHQLLARQETIEEAAAVSGSANPISATARRVNYHASHAYPAQQFRQPSSPVPMTTNESAILKAQAEQLRQLLAQVESAIAQQETPPEPLPQPEPPIVPYPDPRYYAPPAQAPLPHPPQPPLPSEPRQWQAQEAYQQEAYQNAEALRYLAHRERASLPAQSVTPYAGAQSAASTAGYSPLPESPVKPGVPRSKPQRSLIQKFLGVPPKPIDKVGDAVLWVVLAVAARAGLKLFAAAFPAYTPIVVLLTLAPAALAAYLAVFVPRAGWLPIYRLFLITVGLLLGGRF